MRRGLLVVLAVALALRLLVLAATPDYAPGGDPADYDRHAASLAEVGTYAPTAFADPGGPSALRPPAYPYLLAAVYEATGARWTAARLAGVALGVMAVGLLYLLVAEVFDRRRALWAAGIAAVAPTLVWVNGALVAETLFVPLVLGVALAVAVQRRRGGLALAAVAGALLGLAVLTRSNGLILLLAVAIGLWGGRRPWAAPVVAVLALAVVLVPWTARNAAVFGGFLPLGTQSGYTMAGQYNAAVAKHDDFRAAWRVPQDVPGFADLFHRPGRDEAEVDVALRRRALDFAADHPGHVLSALGLNALRLMDLGPGHRFVSSISYGEMGVPGGQIGSVRLGLYLLLAVAVAGLITARAGPLWLWLIPIALFLSVAPLLGAPRYRVPVDPFLAILAALAIVAWRERRVDAAR